MKNPKIFRIVAQKQGLVDFTPTGQSNNPNSSEIDPTAVPFSKIEPLYEKDVKVFLDNCLDCDELGITIDTVTGGYFDEISLDQVRRAEKELQEFLEMKHNDILEEIAQKKDLLEETQKKLQTIAKDFLAKFKTAAKSA